MLTYDIDDLGPVIINYPFDNYQLYFDNYWNNKIDIILDTTDFKQIKIDKIILEVKKGLQELRIKYTNCFYRFPTNVFYKVYFDERFKELIYKII